jgi:hypothetical protein
LIIDLKKMNQVHVFPEDDWKAEIGGGTLLGKVTKELFAQGQRAIGKSYSQSLDRRSLTNNN